MPARNSNIHGAGRHADRRSKEYRRKLHTRLCTPVLLPIPASHSRTASVLVYQQVLSRPRRCHDRGVPYWKEVAASAAPRTVELGAPCPTTRQRRPCRDLVFSRNARPATERRNEGRKPAALITRDRMIAVQQKPLAKPATGHGPLAQNFRGRTPPAMAFFLWVRHEIPRHGKRLRTRGPSGQPWNGVVPGDARSAFARPRRTDRQYTGSLQDIVRRPGAWS